MDGARYRGDRRFVKRRVDALHGRTQGIIISNINSLKFDIAPNFSEISFMSGKQVVDDNHPVRSARQQAAHEG